MTNVTTLVQLLVDGLLIGGLFSLESMGLLIIYGVLKILNLAHGEMLLIGAYLSFAAFAINPLLGPLLSFPIMIALGFGIQKYLFTGAVMKRRTSPLIITFGISLILQTTFFLLFTANPVGIPTGVSSLEILGIYLPQSTLVAFVVAVISLAVVYMILTKTFLGIAIRAVTQSPDDAYLVGIKVTRVRLTAFMMGTVLAGFAGSVLTLQYAFNPYSGLTFTLIGFTIIVLSGFSVQGVLVAGTILGVAQSLWGFFLPIEYANVIVFVIFLVAVVIRPSGLLGKEGV